MTAEPIRRRSGLRRVGVVSLWILLALSGVVVGHDLSVPPSAQWLNRVALAGIDTYQATLSPLMPNMGVNCRFEPTCSHYGEAALRARGVFRGGALAGWRVLRCGPWSPAGSFDPPPQAGGPVLEGSPDPVSRPAEPAAVIPVNSQ